MNITSVIGNNSWKFHDDAIIGTRWKGCDRQTHRQAGRRAGRQTDRQTDTDRTIHRIAWSQLINEILRRGDVFQADTTYHKITLMAWKDFRITYPLWSDRHKRASNAELWCSSVVSLHGQKVYLPVIEGTVRLMWHHSNETTPIGHKLMKFEQLVQYCSLSSISANYFQIFPLSVIIFTHHNAHRTVTHNAV